MLHGALRFAGVPRALVRSIDTAAARAVPGVVAVLTAADVPGRREQGLIRPDWPLLVAEGEIVRYVGDVLAAVAAETREAAAAAAALIEVELEALAAVTDPFAALADGAPEIHVGGNVVSRSVVRRGDVDAALAGAAHVASASFRTAAIEHAFLEPEAALAVPSGSVGPDGATVTAHRVHVYSPGQGAWEDRRQVASFLGLDAGEVLVTQVSTGGAFGGKEDLSVQGQAALLAHVTARPVLLKRPFRVPNVDVEATAVYTNNPPSGAMRGFGANQADFAMEGVLDMLAEQAGIDGWDIRWRNALDVGDRTTTGQKLGEGVGVRATLLAVKDAYKDARYAGIACAIKNVGVGNGLKERGHAVLRPEADGTVTLFHSWTEMGQGCHTVFRDLAAAELGLDPARIRVVVDTHRELDTGETTSSRATMLGGRAVLEACAALRAALEALGPDGRLEDLADRDFAGSVLVDWTTKLDADAAEPVTHFAYGWATQVVILDEEGRVERIVAAHDVGKALNPVLLRGQVEGGVHMGLGMALTEAFETEDGIPVTGTLKSLGIIPAAAMPPVETILVEVPQPEGPYGAKGMGEAVLVPTAAAVAGALYAFDGIRRTSTPMRDSAAARALLPRLARDAAKAAKAADAAAPGEAGGES